MIKSNEDVDAVIFTLSPELGEIEAVLDKTGAFLSQNTIHDQHIARLLLRELLMNAIEHGERGDSDRRIFCEVECEKAVRLKITVEDEGIGFKPEDVDMGLPDIPKPSDRRGYVLIKALSDRLEFNEKANRVTAQVTIPLSPIGSAESSNQATRDSSTGSSRT